MNKYFDIVDRDRGQIAKRDKMYKRKCLNNNKSKRLHGTKEGKAGTLLPLLDKNRTLLSVGDYIRYGIYKGILLYNYHYKQYGIAIESSALDPSNKYDIDSYGTFVSIPMDNGDMVKIEKIEV